MGNVALLSQGNDGALTPFQKSKLIFDFNTFFDLNKDGVLSYKDFLWAKDRICQISGWKVGSKKRFHGNLWVLMWQVNCEKYKRTEALFTKIWTSLVASADTDHDGKISSTEWLLLWESYKRELVERERSAENFLAQFYEAKNPDFRHLKEDGAKLGDVGEWDEVEQRWKPRKLIPVPEDTILPGWLHDYLTYRFDLLDRTGDGEIDTEEFEYVLSEFGIREKDSKQAFEIFSQHGAIKVDFAHFVRLFEEFYLSDDPAELGNFVNGKLEFPCEQQEEEEQEQGLTFEEQIERDRDDLNDNYLLGETKVEKESKEKEKPRVNCVVRIFNLIKGWFIFNCQVPGD